MASGAYSPEAKEVLTTVYPTLYAQAKQDIGIKLASSTEPISYDKKVALSKIFGPEILNMDAVKMTILQSNFSGDTNSESMPSGPKVTNIKPADKTQELTKAQKLLTR